MCNPIESHRDFLLVRTLQANGMLVFSQLLSWHTNEWFVPQAHEKLVQIDQVCQTQEGQYVREALLGVYA